MRGFLFIGLAAMSIASAPADEPGFRVQFDIDQLFTDEWEERPPAGSFVIKVVPTWAPAAAKRFRELVDSGFFDDSRIHAVMPSILFEFGYPANSSTLWQWRNRQDFFLPDSELRHSGTPNNERGYVSFGNVMTDILINEGTPADNFHEKNPNSAATKIVVNLGDNTPFNRWGLAPFGYIEDTEQAHVGQDILERVVIPREKMSEKAIEAWGNTYLDEQQGLTKILRARLLFDADMADSGAKSEL